MTTKPSLRDRIDAARTITEVEALLREGDGYRRASEDTKRSWVRAGEEKLRSFTSAREPVSSALHSQ